MPRPLAVLWDLAPGASFAQPQGGARPTDKAMGAPDQGVPVPTTPKPTALGAATAL